MAIDFSFFFLFTFGYIVTYIAMCVWFVFDNSYIFFEWLLLNITNDSVSFENFNENVD